MKRLTEEERRSVVRLAKLGFSLRKVATELHRPKSTVYYHIRLNFGRKYPIPQINLEPSEELGEVVGIFATDGSYSHDSRYHHRITFHLSRYQEDYARMLVIMLESIFGRKPKLNMDWRPNQVIVVLYGKQVGESLRRFLNWSGKKEHTVHLNACALRLGEPFLKGLLRGLVAGDGSIYVPKRRISFGVVSRRLALQYVKVLAIFGIDSHTYPVAYSGKRTLYHVHITSLENVKRFRSVVGLTDPAKKAALDKVCGRGLVA